MAEIGLLDIPPVLWSADDCERAAIEIRDLHRALDGAKWLEGNLRQNIQEREDWYRAEISQREEVLAQRAGRIAGLERVREAAKQAIAAIMVQPGEFTTDEVGLDDLLAALGELSDNTD